MSLSFGWRPTATLPVGAGPPLVAPDGSGGGAEVFADRLAGESAARGAG